MTDARLFQSEANPNAVAQLLKSHNIVGKIVNKRQIVVKVKPYNCPACGDKKDSNNLRISGDKVYCYDHDCKGIQVDSSKTFKLSSKPLKSAIKSESRLVKYSLRQGHHTFVKSQMGTGKTEELLR